MTRRRMKFTGACPIGDRPPEPDHNHSQSLSKPSGCPHNGVHFTSSVMRNARNASIISANSDSQLAANTCPAFRNYALRTIPGHRQEDSRSLRHVSSALVFLNTLLGLQKWPPRGYIFFGCLPNDPRDRNFFLSRDLFKRA